ncbi:RluA family pseudouridine synthase [Pseudolabrys taiwanensis]|uniref:Ribosomal large subunit pseudouridine synthase D n=1 Tax=Pseudolabrys taiwanensis TaxID=331696 RepID=A0A345ZRQ3_9HYPH|nr:RluA family pseudouridine synthase [Pseudolabrys taiwanensis]
MKRGKGGGPRQPGGGRREAGPRQQQRGTRGAARLGGGGRPRSRDDEGRPLRHGDERPAGRPGRGSSGHGAGRGRPPRAAQGEGGPSFFRKSGGAGRGFGEGRSPDRRDEGRGEGRGRPQGERKPARFGEDRRPPRFNDERPLRRHDRDDERRPPRWRDDERPAGRHAEGRNGGGRGRGLAEESSRGPSRRGPKREGGRSFGRGAEERRETYAKPHRPAKPSAFEGRPRRPAQDESMEPAVAVSPALAEATKVQTVTVSRDEDGMRVDRFFEARFPGLSFSHIQRIVRKGEVRLDGKRTEPKARLSVGQQLRIPPLKVEAPPPRPDAPQAQHDRAFIKSITLYEDDDVMVLNKPMGLAVQGGSGTTRHIDGLLGSLRGPHPDAQRPRLVHRLDKDTAGCLLVAKTRFAAAALAKTFRSRSARKIYWALVAGVPKPRQGRISTYLTKQEVEEDSFMRVAEHGEKDAVHAVTYYAVVDTSAQKLAWLSLKPVTGRTHQLRAHMAHVGNPIVGDPKYFNIENWELPGGIQNKLHLLARRIAVPHPRGGTIDVSAPLPPHMEQSWNLLGFDVKRYDPIEDAPEEE